MFYIHPSASPRFLVAVLFVLFMVACDTLNPPPTDDGEPVPTPQSCSATNNELELSEASPIELFLACEIINNPDQQRPEMHYHSTLGEIARARARDMLERGYYGSGREYPPHVDHDGYGPNYYLCLEGYRADLYCVDDPFANNVESISKTRRYLNGGAPTSNYEVAKTVWTESPPHRRHIYGEMEYSANAKYYGVGHATKDIEEEFIDNDGNLRTARIRVSMWVFIAAWPPEISGE